MKYLYLIAIAFIGACQSIKTSNAEEAKWPEVKSIKNKFHLGLEGKEGFELAIPSTQDNPLYELKCHSGDSDYDLYSGLLTCRLISLYSTDSATNLLTEKQLYEYDGPGRARFFVEHLSPICSSYPDWGRTRVFRLRGMKITLSIDHAEFERGVSKSTFVKAYDMSVSIQPDAAAVSPIAENSKEPMPNWFLGPGNLCKE